jgi:CelD/BcsL family acetyltransferase involved in cellulose biosynthesis
MVAKSSVLPSLGVPAALGKQEVLQPDEASSVRAAVKSAAAALTIEQDDNFDRFADAWDDLATRVHAAPWVRPGWLSAWWRAFGAGTLVVFAAWRGSTLVGVLPLRRRFGELFSLTNCHTPQFDVLAEDPAAIQALLRTVLASGRRRVTLGFLTPEDFVFQHDWRALTGHRVFRRAMLRSPYIPIDDSWTDYTKQLGSKFLSEIRRRRRLLAARGHLALQIEDGRERLDELLAEGFQVEASGWKGTAGSAIIAHRETHQFYHEVAHWGAAQGLLRLAFLRLDGRPLAFDYSLEDRGIHYLVKTGYDPDYGKLGPGMLLRYEMLARAFANGLTSYEFLGADAPWKQNWAEKCRERLLFQAFAPSLTGTLEWGVVTYGWNAAKRIAKRIQRP